MSTAFKREGFVPTQCAVCTACWTKPGMARCIYGGPFSGYAKQEETDRDDTGSEEGRARCRLG